MKLKTVEGVEILATGRYALETGEAEFTEAHLADAVRAASDPTIVSPRIKLGHDFDRVFGDAAPAFGKVTNMRLANNGQKIIGDLTDVPDYLAASIAAHYPGRSIEGGFDFTAPSGHDYKLVISDLALLGTEWPGVTNLADLTVNDLEEVLSANGKIETPVKTDDRYKLSGGTAGSLVAAKLSDAKDIRAGLNVADFRRVFASDLRGGKVPSMTGASEQPKWWTRSVEAGDDGRLSLVIDDEGGHLIELPVEVDGEGLKYGEPRFREAVAASSGKGPRVLASWPSTGDRPSTEERQSMKRDEMLKRLGLPEDASDEAIVTATAAKPDALTAETPGGGDNGDGGESGDGDGTGEGSGSESERVAVAASSGKVPDGMVLVDRETFEQVKAGAEDGRTVKAKLDQEDRDKTIRAAVDGGKFAVGRTEHYTKAWDADPEGTRELIASLAEGLVPVSEIGRAGDGSGDTTGGEEQLLARAEAQMFPELAQVPGSALANAAANSNGGAS